MDVGKKAPSAYTGAEHSNIKKTRLDLGHASLITKKKFWDKTIAGGPVSPAVDIRPLHIFCALP